MKTEIGLKWVREIYTGETESGKTFCGILEELYRHIAKNWNNTTRKKYDREYDRVILPALENHNEKTIDEYTKQDFEDAIDRIIGKGYEEHGIFRQYSESSIAHFKNLIYFVVFQASVFGYCSNILWGTSFEIQKTEESSEIEARVRIKKSLTIEQENKLYKELIKDYLETPIKACSEDGAKVALLLMWGLGLRNAEACGLNYGDIKPLEGHNDCHVAWIYKSTKVGTNELQSGGKSINTGRIVPLPDKIKSFLEKRRAGIERLLFDAGETGVIIDDLPICCDSGIVIEPDNCKKRCSADQVTDAAQDVFFKAGILSETLGYLDEELSEDNASAILKEKDPTAYLLRRNFATQMCILGLSTAEMQYLIGHDVEDAYESRNEFVDSERLFSMAEKLKERSLLNDERKEKNTAYSGSLISINVTAKEPTDKIVVSIQSKNNGSGLRTKWYEGHVKPKFERSIDILNDYHSKYRSKQKNSSGRQ